VHRRSILPGLVLRQELQRRTGLPAVVAVEETQGMVARRLRSIQFQRFRGKHGDDGGRRSTGGFRITFAAPVAGPLCLGQSCIWHGAVFAVPDIGARRTSGLKWPMDDESPASFSKAESFFDNSILGHTEPL